MEIKTFQVDLETPDALAKIRTDLQACGSAPDFITCHHDIGLSSDKIRTALSGFGEALHIASSCNGAITGAASNMPFGAAVLCIWDEEGDYGTACRAFGTENASDTAAQAVGAALSQIERTGEKPDIILLSATPGHEENVLAGIADVVGADVPVIGGSAADNTVSGDWQIGDAATTTGAGLVVSVLFPSGQVHFTYQNGYAPTGQTGTVTKASGRRVHEIDRQAAGAIFANWSGGRVIPSIPDKETNILAAATLAPLGRYIGKRGGLTDYLLVHPAVIHADGSLDLFAEVSEGEVVTQMTGTHDALTERAGRVAQQAVDIGAQSGGEIAGAFMVYCGGCFMAVQDNLAGIVTGVATALGHRPFLGTFTFGEQGPIAQQGNRHGNLMISCIVFYKAH